MNRMHRFLRQFILNGMERGSDVWPCLFSVHEVVETKLEKEGSSFRKFRDKFENNHREFCTCFGPG